MEKSKTSDRYSPEMRARAKGLGSAGGKGQRRTGVGATSAERFGRRMRSCARRRLILRSPLSRFARKPLPGNGTSTARPFKP